MLRDDRDKFVLIQEDNTFRGSHEISGIMNQILGFCNIRKKEIILASLPLPHKGYQIYDHHAYTMYKDKHWQGLLSYHTVYYLVNNTGMH